MLDGWWCSDRRHLRPPRSRQLRKYPPGCPRPLPPPQQFLHAVKYCHTHQVAHRDLKLDNTLLDRCGAVGGQYWAVRSGWAP